MLSFACGVFELVEAVAARQLEMLNDGYTRLTKRQPSAAQHSSMSCCIPIQELNKLKSLVLFLKLPPSLNYPADCFLGLNFSV